MTDIFIGYLVPAIHVLACLFLIVVVLLQTGKGADMGAVFGGGSQTLFGAGGAGNLLTKLTTGTAIAFMLTSLILSYGQTRQPGSRLLERIPAEAPAPAPVAPPAAPSPSAAAPAPPPAPTVTKTVSIPVAPKAAQPTDAPAPTPAPAPAADK